METLPNPISKLARTKGGTTADLHLLFAALLPMALPSHLIFSLLLPRQQRGLTQLGGPPKPTRRRLENYGVLLLEQIASWLLEDL